MAVNISHGRMATRFLFPPAFLYSSSRPHFLQLFSQQASHFSSSPVYEKLPSPSVSEKTSSPPSSISANGSTSTVNPPDSTRPVLLELPDKSSSSAGITYYISLGRAYFKFYKTGLKNVYFNYRASLPLRQQLGLPAYIPRSPWTPGTLNRADFQLVRRSAYDVRRMIPFSLILLACGEFTPLVVLALGTRVTPLTCRVPKQLEKERTERMARKNSAILAAGGSGEAGTVNPQCLPRVDVATMPAQEVMRACVVFGLAKAHELRVPGLEGLMMGSVYRPRLARWLEYLAADDGLIRAAGGVELMGAEEVRIAVDERGGVDVGAGMEQEDVQLAQRKWLDRWLAGGN
ncbi:hypothetical protein FQN57_005631 [Myotisia sp. PD_48]|nr:hypothetical protein FQN57_005631 [Myotisia sp. PD_48]